MTTLSTVIKFPHKSNLEREQSSMAQSTPKPIRRTALIEETLQTRKLKSLKPRLRELVSMLETCRPGGSATEEMFISHFIDTLPNMQQDEYGNRYCQVGKAKPTIAWSCHTDTVHSEEGTQAIEIDKSGHLSLDWNSESDCLGADCTAGVWLMRRMILAGKPGLYIFHRDEENGGLGSKWIAGNRPQIVDGIQAMIAVDRRGYDSVVTEQTTGITASKKFAQSLADQLGGKYAPDDGGIFTDSAFYSHLIPECTNISVGYFCQHSRHETLDYEFLDSLLLSLLALDYSALEIARSPCEPRSRYKHYYSSHYVTDSDERYYRDQWDYDRPTPRHLRPDIELDDIPFDTTLADLIRRNPEAVAMLLMQWDLGEREVYEAIAEYDDMQDTRRAM